VIAGPSGAGKGTVIRKLLEREPGTWFSVSYATRAPRPGEEEGVDYHFVDRPEFLALRDAGGFLESFEVYGDLKGTPREPVERHLAGGDDVLLELDIQGALAVREQYPEALLVFVKAPSRDEQRRRVLGRAVEVPEDVEQRLGAAEAEEAQAAQFDAVVVNDDVDTAVDQVAGILAARRSGP
jgi:guanylate kinase